MVLAVTSTADFDAELGKAGDKAVVVDFHATWCGPCKMIAPFLQEQSEKHVDKIVLKVDVDEVEDVAMKYEVAAMPTFIVFKNGSEVDRMTGASKEKLAAIFEKTY